MSLKVTETAKMGAMTTKPIWTPEWCDRGVLGTNQEPLSSWWSIAVDGGSFLPQDDGLRWFQKRDDLGLAKNNLPWFRALVDLGIYYGCNPNMEPGRDWSEELRDYVWDWQDAERRRCELNQAHENCSGIPGPWEKFPYISHLERFARRTFDGIGVDSFPPFLFPPDTDEEDKDELVDRILTLALCAAGRVIVLTRAICNLDQPVIYFMEADEQDVITIGRSRSPEMRLHQHRRGCPYNLRLYGVLPAQWKSEGEIHAMFKADRRSGSEWFQSTQAIRDFVLVSMLKLNWSEVT